MSEEPTENSGGKQKKKGKLPVILALVLVLGGGGFFAMKGKGGPKKVVVKAGTVESLEKEFLVNLGGSGTNVYLRAEMAFELREGFTKEKLDESMPAIRDCINQILRAKSLQQVGANNTDRLRKQISAAVNEIIVEHMSDEDKKHQEEFEKAVQPKDEKDKGKKGKDKHSSDDDEEAHKWSSPAGPVLEVYFTSFTTQ